MCKKITDNRHERGHDPAGPVRERGLLVLKLNRDGSSV